MADEHPLSGQSVAESLDRRPEPDNAPEQPKPSAVPSKTAKPTTPPPIPPSFVTPPPFSGGRKNGSIPGAPPPLSGLSGPRRRSYLPLIFSVVVGLLILAGLVFGVGYFADSRQKATPSHVTLTMWGVLNDPQVVQSLINGYEQNHPNVSIAYVSKDIDTYEFAVNNAIAEGNAPDIWQARSDWLPRERNKLSSAPARLTTADFLQIFPPIVGLDFIWPRPPLDSGTGKIAESDLTADHKIYGLPWSLDTLALYYNRDLFAKAGISAPPATWDEVIADVKKLRVQNGNDLKVGGIAMGTGQNLNRPSDIIAALMLQNGATMVSPDGKSALFNRGVKLSTSSDIYPAGTNALQFFTSFSDPSKEAYSWNASFPNAIQAFAHGQVAMFIGYSNELSTLYQLSPSLSFDVAPLPQISGTTHPVTLSLYWGNVVSKTSKNADAAWDFLIASANKEPMQNYWQATKKPPARADLISELSGTPRYGVFMSQTKYASSYYKGTDPTHVDQILTDMIDNVAIKGQPIQISIDGAAKQMTDVLNQAGP